MRAWLAVVNVLLGVVLGAAAARAPALADDVPPGPIDPPQLSSQLVDFWWEEAAFDDFSFDTGWVPSGSDVQVRFAVTALGRTEVGLGGTALVAWPDPLTVTVPGRAQTGWLSIGYGVAILARLRIDVTILGTDYVWEGDLPFVDLPSDLLMADDLEFDPFVLPGADPRPVSVSDTTERIRALTYDVAGLVGIPGVEGSISLDVQGALTAAYQSERIDVTSDAPPTGPIVVEGGATRLDAPAPEGYGRAVDFDVLPIGTVDYVGGVILYPHVTVAVVGVEIIDEDLAMIPVDFPLTTVDTIFQPAPVHVPLPDVLVTPAELAITTAAPGPVTFHNAGEADLVVSAVAWPAPLLDAPFDVLVPAGQARPIEVTAAGTGEGSVTVDATFSTSDPDKPLITLPVTITFVRAPDPGDGDAGPGPGGGEAAAGCGCRAGTRHHRGGLGTLLAVLAMVATRRQVARGSRR